MWVGGGKVGGRINVAEMENECGIYSFVVDMRATLVAETLGRQASNATLWT